MDVDKQVLARYFIDRNEKPNYPTRQVLIEKEGNSDLKQVERMYDFITGTIITRTFKAGNWTYDANNISKR